MRENQLRPFGDRCNNSQLRASFALAVEPAELVEGRRELVREVQHWLGEWEVSRSEVARGRLVQSLEVLALLLRSATP